MASYLMNYPMLEKEFEFHGYSSKQIQLLKRKDVYPYEFTNSFDSLKTNHLLNEKEFYSCLNDKHISDKYNVHAQMVSNVFNIQDLVTILWPVSEQRRTIAEDVFEDLRHNCMKSYQLDAGHY